MFRWMIFATVIASSGCDDATATGDSLADQQSDRGWGPDKCPATPAGAEVGYLLGNQLDELVFKDCEGNAVDVREVCGADVVWIALAHTWCPHCQENARIMEDLHTEMTDDGVNLASLNVLVENSDFEPPDGDLCETWREEYGQSGVLTFYDDAQTSLVLFEEPFTALNVLLDRDRLIRVKIHTDVSDDIREMIDFALH